MTVPGEPTFTQLVDWLEGRLDEEESAAVGRLVEMGSAATRASAQWIGEFIDAARAMPLAQPPAEVGEAARLAFRRHLAPWAPEGYLDAALTLDSRDRRSASGMRSGATDRIDHLVFENDLVRLLLDVSANPASPEARIDIRGTVSTPGTDRAEHLDLVFTSAQTVRHSLRCPPGGRFEAVALPMDVDALWVSLHGRVVRALLPRGDQG